MDIGNAFIQQIFQSKHPGNIGKLDKLLTMCQYFGLTRARKNKSKVLILDVKCGIPLPLLSCIIEKLLPSDKIGFNDTYSTSHLHGMKEMSNDLRTFIETGSRVEGLQLIVVSGPEEFEVSDSDTFVVPNPDNLPAANIYDYGVVPPEQDTSSYSTQGSYQTNISIREEFQTPYPGFVVITPADAFKPFTKYISEEWPNLDEDAERFGENQTEIAGPSVKMTRSKYETHAKLTVKVEAEKDLVYAYPVPDWPQQANSWISRQRPASWPDRALIEKIVKQGMHYVRKPPPNLPVTSMDLKDFYWRLSFSLAERDLAASFNDTQRQCALLLKILKGTAGFPANILTSYHMKTIMFWICENVPQRIWKPGRLAKCFLFVLDYLIVCIMKGNIPHYFIPELNLLSGKPKKHINTILQKVLYYRSHPFEVIARLKTSHARWVIDEMKGKEIDHRPFMTEDYVMAKVEEDVKGSYVDINMLVAIQMIVSSRKFQQNKNSEVFKETMSYLEEGIQILHKTMGKDLPMVAPMFDNILDQMAMAYFTEDTIRPYYLYAKEKCPEKFEHYGENRDILLVDPSRPEVDFYQNLQLNYSSPENMLQIMQMKMHLQLLTMVFQFAQI